MKTVLSVLFSSRYLPDFLVLSLVGVLQTMFAADLLRGVGKKARAAVIVAWAVSAVVLAFGFLLRFARVARHFPLWFSGWGRGLAMLWGFFSVMMIVVYVVSHVVPKAKPEDGVGRRRFLKAARAALFGVPAVAVGYGTFIQRFQLRLREQRVEIPGLPEGLHGIRIAQLTDLHVSPFLSVKELARAVEMANETKPHLTLVTGDLISTGNDPLDDCLDALAKLKSDAGVYGCMGNHEIYADSEAYTQVEGAKRGMRFLRQEREMVRFGSAGLNLAGVDYQLMHRRPYLRGAEKLVAPGAFNLLMSHNPDVFPVAAQKGFQLVVAGHTHGGQVRVEILRQDLNVARFFTPYVDGMYREAGASIFVSRGIGTIAIPTRLGAPPEVALLTLCRI
ncbi:MAG TPA: metallophosphoesterase [Bryobacteraceae bacterium]|jgi:hypothetical protein